MVTHRGFSAQFDELVKQSYADMVAAKDNQHMAAFCNVVLNIMDKFHKDCINTTKRILFTNMAIKHPLPRGEGFMS